MKSVKILIVALAIAAFSFAPRMVVMAPTPTQSSSEGWKKNNVGWWYENANGNYTTNNWQKINGIWYYFNASGYMQTGWLLKGNTWYYLKPDGAMKTGWLQEGKTWYYLTADGAMKTGWLQEGGKWYYLKSNGAMQTGWLQDGGKWYYLYSNGAMAVNTIVDGYYVNSSGVWIPNTSNSGNNTTNNNTNNTTNNNNTSNNTNNNTSNNTNNNTSNNTNNNTSNNTNNNTNNTGNSGTPITISSNKSRDWNEIMALAETIYNQNYNEIKAMHAGLNQIRAEVGKSALELDATLSKEAIARGIHMISFGYFSHYYNGQLHLDVTNELYNIKAMGENIAYTTKTADTGATLNKNWKGSEGHYKNMIGNYTKVGIAYVPNDKNQIYGVQLFK